MTAQMTATEVRMISDPRKGKGLFARKPFQFNDVILEERPGAEFAFMEALKGSDSCKECRRLIETAQDAARRLTTNASLVLPHPECCTVDTSTHISCPHCQEVFCSEKCWGESWTRNHSKLCLDMEAVKNDPEHPKETWRDLFHPPEVSKLIRFINMPAVGGKTQMEILQQSVRKAVDYLKKQWETPERLEAMAVLHTNGLGIGMSSFAEWLKKCCALDLSEEERKQLIEFVDKTYAAAEKVAVRFINSGGSPDTYAYLSACNHSCRPNAEVSSVDKDKKVTLRANRDIKLGEEICISYTDPCFLDQGRYSRQRHLENTYCFVCCCSQCLRETDSPDETTDEEMSSEEMFEEPEMES
ncbi:protein-lysine N-trimethyltransferase SMYD5-like [Babylonia areolata]|uniref:protein-lysine N-trimethyltransferase SMYD5-like n=1 Tax=Babylonia areolata TaxID=304850 RepID=UPI003FD339DB